MLKEAEMTLYGEASRKHGVSEWSLYRWRKKCGDMDISDAKRLRSLEKENVRLKRIVAENETRWVTLSSCSLLPAKWIGSK